MGLVTHRAARILLTGDAYGHHEASHKYEQNLLEKHKDDPYFSEIDVLKITHHGSKHGTSQEFVDATQPKINLASSADSSHKGHALEPRIRTRLSSQLGILAVVRTTNKNGDISVRTEGRRVTFSGHRGVLYELNTEV